MRKLIARWGAEAGIFLLLFVRFLFERYAGIAGWSPTWYALDYSMGRGSRLLAGSILHLLSPGIVGEREAYLYICVVLMLCCLLLALFFGRAYRLTGASCRPAALLLIGCYLCAPFSVRYLWNDANMGRLDAFLLLLTLCCGLFSLSVKRFYPRLFVLTAVGVVALLFHQVYFFIFYPFVLSMLFYDAFTGETLNRKRFFALLCSALLTSGVFLLLQFGSRLHAPSADALISSLKETTDLAISKDALEFEYFQDFSYNLQNAVLPFYRGENPLGHAVATFITLLPVLGLFGYLWSRLLSGERKKGARRKRPYPYLLLSNLMYLPAFLLAIDWSRWFAAFLACQTFLFLFLLARRDPAMEGAGAALSAGVQKRPLPFLLGLCYLSGLSTFGARYFTWEANCVYDWIRTLIFSILGGRL